MSEPQAVDDAEIEGVPGVPEIAPVDDPRCDASARLAASGDHKPAVDGLREVRRDGSSCAASVVEAVAASEEILRSADALVHVAQEARRAGDLATAAATFEQALALYPKYHWARKLRDDLETATADEATEPAADRLREQASDLAATGRTQQALAVLETALDRAESGDDAAAIAADLQRLRNEVGDSRLAAAYRAEREGDLARAIEHAIQAIEARPGYPVRDRVVDLSRRLGLELFSVGELSDARSLWQSALALDPGNELLRQYLEEVANRLHALDEIKKNRDP